MHELQHNVVSILYMIKGFMESHINRYEEGLFHDREAALSHAQEVMKRAYAQTERALLITKRISLTMKISNGSEPERVSIQAVWSKVIDILKKQHPGDGSEIVSHIPDEFPRILCGRNDLEEILYCLADNAIQAMRGKGKLILRVNLGFRTGEDPIASITVADTGPGMPEETLNRLFEPFVTTKPLDKGNGLGLCLVKGLVRKNGGSVSVSSFKGYGTTFALTFSVARLKGSGQIKPDYEQFERGEVT